MGELKIPLDIFDIPPKLQITKATKTSTKKPVTNIKISLKGFSWISCCSCATCGSISWHPSFIKSTGLFAVAFGYFVVLVYKRILCVLSILNLWTLYF